MHNSYIYYDIINSYNLLYYNIIKYKVDIIRYIIYILLFYI